MVNCADDESYILNEKHCQFLTKRRQREESARQDDEENKQRASAKKHIKLIKKARQKDDRQQGNVHPQEQAAMKKHEKSLEHTTQSSVTTFFRPRPSNTDPGETAMTPLTNQKARTVPMLFLFRCRYPCLWTINTWFLSVILSASL